MQISNNQTNLNFNGAFKIKPSELKAQTEIPALFTQGMQKFTNIEEKGDMFIVVRDNYDKRIGNYLSENHVNGVKYYPTINTKSGLDDEKPEGLLALLKDKSIEVKTGEKNDLQDALRSPLPGTIVDIPVKVGLEVKEGDTLIVLEAMKMDNNLTAERDGKIKAILVNEGDAVKENTPLVTFE